MSRIFAALIFIFGFTVDVGAADKPVGWVVKPKPDCTGKHCPRQK